MTTATATQDEVKELKASTKAIADKIQEIKGIVINKEGHTVLPDIFAQTLPETITLNNVTDVLTHITEFNAACADVATKQAVSLIAADPSYSAEIVVPIAKGNGITMFIEGTKETSDGKGGRQTVHGSVASKLTVRGWKAGGFGIVKQQFRAACTAAMNK